MIQDEGQLRNNFSNFFALHASNIPMKLILTPQGTYYTNKK